MLLAFDLGTTNIKATVTDLKGETLSRASVPISLARLEDGGVEQDLEEIWSAVQTACQQAVRGADATHVRAIGISSQGAALQLLDEQMQPAGAVVSWLDGRGVPHDEALNRELGRPWFAERIGHCGSGMAIGQLERLLRTTAAKATAVRRVGFVGDAMVERFTGAWAQDCTSAAITCLYNPRLRGYDPEILARLSLTTHQLPSLHMVRKAAGPLQPEVARRLGLPAGIPVSLPVHDQYAACLGTGALSAGDIMFGAGTAWVLLAVTDAWLPPVSEDAFVANHVIEPLFGQILSLRTGGSAISWALETTGLNRETKAGVDALLSQVPPGSHGLRFWPFLMSSAPAHLPPGLKGRLDGLQLAHSAVDILRAVVEGLAFELDRQLHFLRRAGMNPGRILMCGGAASGSVTPQILADVTGLSIVCLEDGEASVRGAAVIARSLLEPESSLTQLAKEMACPSRVVAPGADHAFYRSQAEAYLHSLPTAPSDAAGPAHC